jgi:hypothetical protein
VALEKLEHLLVAARNLRLCGCEIVSARHEPQRPQRKIGGHLALGEPFHLDITVGGAAARKSPTDKSATDGDTEREDERGKERAVSHGRSTP